MSNKPHRLAIGLLVGGMLIASCDRSSSDSTDRPGWDYDSEIRLIRARMLPMTCEEMNDHRKEEALAVLSQWASEQARVVSEGDCSEVLSSLPYPYYGDDDDDLTTASDDDDDDSSSDGGGPDDYTETNTQEEGVDEADMIKTNGQYIYYLEGAADHSQYGYYYNNTGPLPPALAIYDAWPPSETRLASRTPISGTPTDMFLNGDRLVVYSTVPLAGLPGEVSEALSQAETHHPYGLLTRISVLDVSDPASPVLLREIFLEGGRLQARRIGSKVFTVLNSFADSGPQWNAYWEADLQASGCWNNGAVNPNPAWRMAAIQRLNAHREESARLIGDWSAVSKYGALASVNFEHSPATLQTAPMVDCSRLYVPSEGVQPGYLTVSTFDLDAPDALPRNTSITAQGQMLYAAQEALYVSLTYWPNGQYYWDEGTPASEFTVVHRFLLDHDAGEAVYSASGAVPGWLLNQFSMSDYDGHLRLATTEGHVGRTLDNPVHSNVFVMRAVGDNLKVVGEIDQIAPTEQIYSARFVGPKGYLVTFQKVDPLFTIDLSVPESPRLVGELKIPGFSTYMHPLGANHLLTIGLDTQPGTDETFSWYQGIQVTIFDVSDFANPKQAFKEVVGGRGSYSPALSNHKDFTYYGSRKLLAFPATTFTFAEGGGSNMGHLDFTGAKTFEISPITGIEPRLSIDHMDFYSNGNELEMCWSLEQVLRVQKLVMIEDSLYSFSSGGLLVTDLGSGDELARVANDTGSMNLTCYGYYED